MCEPFAHKYNERLKWTARKIKTSVRETQVRIPEEICQNSTQSPSPNTVTQTYKELLLLCLWGFSVY